MPFSRSGVKKLRLIDFDNVTLSSLNRHAIATRADVGKVPNCRLFTLIGFPQSKATVLKEHLHRIVPACNIEALTVMFEADCADELLSGVFLVLFYVFISYTMSQENRRIFWTASMM
jgi:tRNA A37 threonylcarbamoyladenosine dehydratase